MSRPAPINRTGHRRRTVDHTLQSSQPRLLSRKMTPRLIRMTGPTTPPCRSRLSIRTSSKTPPQQNDPGDHQQRGPKDIEVQPAQPGDVEGPHQEEDAHEDQ